jgi:hypothetical protein
MSLSTELLALGEQVGARLKERRLGGGARRPSASPPLAALVICIQDTHPPGPGGTAAGSGLRAHPHVVAQRVSLERYEEFVPHVRSSTDDSGHSGL